MTSLRDAGENSDARAAHAERLALELSRMVREATEHGFPLVARLLDMALLEAWREAGDRRGQKDDNP